MKIPELPMNLEIESTHSELDLSQSSHQELTYNSPSDETSALSVPQAMDSRLRGNDGCY
ncbi:MAG: hypothetical protein R3B84_14825 [Zavarzinella sp.]